MIGSALVGVLNDDLRVACLAALTLSLQACLAFAQKHTWEASAQAFVDQMATRAQPTRWLKFEPKHPRFVA